MFENSNEPKKESAKRANVVYAVQHVDNAC